MTRSQSAMFVPAEGRRQPLYRAEIINRRLVYAMFSLAGLVLLYVAYAAWSDRTHVGQPPAAEVVFQRTLTLTGNGNAVTVLDETGAPILDTENGGFIAVVIDGLERARIVAQVEGNPPVTVTQFENGRLMLADPASGWNAELASFGPGNLGIWQRLVTP